VSALGDYDNGEIGGMIGRGNRSTWRNPAPVPLCPPQTPHTACTQTRAAAVGCQRLTAGYGTAFTHIHNQKLGDELTVAYFNNFWISVLTNIFMDFMNSHNIEIPL
jgi:hypothetical protein